VKGRPGGELKELAEYGIEGFNTVVNQLRSGDDAGEAVKAGDDVIKRARNRSLEPVWRGGCHHAPLQ
jgi:hypothetical protein